MAAADTEATNVTKEILETAEEGDETCMIHLHQVVDRVLSSKHGRKNSVEVSEVPPLLP
jgi:hypothetical protein